MNLFILSLVSTVFILESASCFTIKQNATDKKSAIIGGYEISERVGFHVSLRCRNNYFCAGALISPKLVLTAAHCVKHVEDNDCYYDVFVLGGANHKEAGYQIPAESFVKHPQYSPVTEEHDIGIISLKSPFRMDHNIWTIPLTPYPPQLYEHFTVTGYGRVHPQTLEDSVILRAYETSLLTYEECYKRNGDEVHPSDICDLGEPNVGTCQGDSGGPVFNKDYLIGVVSRGLSPKNPVTGVVHCTVGKPNLFASVYYHLDFINYYLSLV